MMPDLEARPSKRKTSMVARIVSAAEMRGRCTRARRNVC